ncbi:MAG: 30S ribosome-binding factor RbfA [Alphaproteobacteria bacterium]|nr:30S ribosome-binding factor RbfA [Alphaproteobacteria bacterium]MBU0859980.1 30S ribosome-binding factor RbfA [Alphaproteobacteria bacterium]
MSSTDRNNLGPTQRQLRVAEQVRHILAETMQRGKFNDPVLYEGALNVTVAEVRMSPDMKHARAYVMTLGGRNMDTILPALNNASGMFQKELAKKLTMKFTPRVHFVTDETFDEAEKIDNLLRGLPEAPRG